jgi:hypothetical protein
MRLGRCDSTDQTGVGSRISLRPQQPVGSLTSPAKLSRFTATLFALVLAPACAGGPSATPVVGPSATAVGSPVNPTASGTLGPTASGTLGPTASSPPTPSPTFHDIALDEAIARATGGLHPAGSELDQLWQGIMAGADLPVQSPYEAPRRVFGYPSGELPDTACTPRTRLSDWLQNSRYCPDDLTIAYDESWLRDFATRFGSFAPIAILAHEWGHHAQTFMGIQGSSMAIELQADCFAGIYLARTQLPLGFLGGTEFDAGKVQAATEAFFDIGYRDYSASKWFQAGYGSSEQRLLALSTGFISGGVESLPWCYGYRDFKVPDVADIGPYQLLNLPGRTETNADGVYSIAPESRTGYATSAIHLTWLDTLPVAGEGAGADQLNAVAARDMAGATLLAGSDLSSNVGAGSAYAEYFIDRGSQAARTGWLALVSPASNVGGLLITVSGEQAVVSVSPSPGTPVVNALAEQLVSLYEVMLRLCGPDQSGDPAAPNFRRACSDQQ